MKLFSQSERITVDMSTIGRPEDRNLYGDGEWGRETYYADWCGIARKYRPKRVLEMGVHLGYGALALIIGSGCHRYVGIDDQREVPGSNEKARTNLKSQNCWTSNDRIIEATFQEPPDPRMAEVLELGPFDFISVDANHTIVGTQYQLNLAWATSAPGAIIVVDDFRDPLVREGWERFLMSLAAAVAVQYYENERGWLIVRREA